MLKEPWPSRPGMDLLDKCLLSVEEFYDEGDNFEGAEKKNKVLNEKKEDNYFSILCTTKNYSMHPDGNTVKEN